MARRSSLASLLLIFGSSAALAGPNNLCAVPSAEYTFNAIEKLPPPVVTALKQRFAHLQPTMASCPQVGPSTDDDRDSPCFVKAGQYGSRWIVAVATRGAKAIHGFTVITYTQGQNAQVIAPGESPLIPVCALNNFAGIQPTGKPRMQQKPAVSPP